MNLERQRGNIHRNIRIKSERRSDLTMNLLYTVDDHQRISAEFIFGSRYYDLDSVYYGDLEMKAYPVSPMLHYRYLNVWNRATSKVSRLGNVPATADVLLLTGSRTKGMLWLQKLNLC